MGFNYASVASGSCGNCHYIGFEGTGILVDAGLSGKKVRENLESIELGMDGLKAILITHEHVDHIKGAGILSRKHDIPIYANARTWQEMGDKLGKVSPENIQVFETGRSFDIGSLRIKAFGIHHDAADPVGFCIDNGKKKLSIATDTGCICDEIRGQLHDSDLVVLESNHDVEMLKMGAYPYHLKRRILSSNGHLSNDDAALFCVELANEGVKRVLLAHLSRENNFPELAYETVVGTLKIKGIENISIDVLLRQQASRVYSI
ncbi:putative metallo-hydrolase YycJ [Peptoclostridium acidaminophilum DSM 3953]|uniref:Putative metallo-hydrolase YycJ n=1 Tax=Peptoclostridium acidaminophilum DSM 3953 TaxID=1286171 RepID=W8T975_PEPAC|nr:MBL fold metallo-hydrolase [Peptoclostridium acidaminophilum]AHM57465.1 putative metallo-hydrolase YycJ [Peptoclostridium acidaminophilum DSM 3953]